MGKRDEALHGGLWASVTWEWGSLGQRYMGVGVLWASVT